MTTIPQIRYIEDEDLLDLGMSKPEIRRLKKYYKRECPQGALGKIKRVRSYRVNSMLLTVSSALSYALLSMQFSVSYIYK